MISRIWTISIAKLLLLLSSNLIHISLSSKVRVGNITCSSDYQINVQSVSFDCADQCGFGTTAYISSSLIFYDIPSLDLYVDTSLNFEAWAQDSNADSKNNVIQNLKFTDYSPICAEQEDDDSTSECSYEAGEFQWAYNYYIPSTENMAGYSITTRLLFYTAENENNIVGDCEIVFTTNNDWFHKYYNRFNRNKSNSSGLVDDNSIKLWYTKCALVLCLTGLIVAAFFILGSSRRQVSQPMFVH